jgi:hypothetical protein
MTSEQAARIRVGDEVLVGSQMTRTIVSAVFLGGMFPPYFRTLAEPLLTSYQIVGVVEETNW